MVNKKHKALTQHRSEIRELLNSDIEERIDRIEDEFSRGFDIINDYVNTVTVFGSARTLEDNKYYKKARKLTNDLASRGFTVVTGGGSGIMEAANRGAHEAGGNSIGLNIKLPHEQVLNPYTTDSMAFRYFFSRKVMLAYAASALICFPGGFGTMDEMFEVLTLVQTKKMPKTPIIFIGSEFWQPLDDFIKNILLEKYGVISHGDEKLYTITDDIGIVVDIVEKNKEIKSTIIPKK